MANRSLAFLLVQPGNIVIGQLFERVQSHNIPAVGGLSPCLHAGHDRIELLLILRIDLRPEHLLGSLPIEIPVALRRIFKIRLAYLEQIGDFVGELISMLITNLLGLAFEMDEDPTVLFLTAAPQQQAGVADGFLAS